MISEAIHERAHDTLVLQRRMRVLARAGASLLPESGTVLDVGCGNGEISAQVASRKPGLQFFGIDIAKRPSCAIPMTVYDGTRIPFAVDSYDYAIFVDVLHHTPDPLVLLKEAKRVARKGIVIKDHISDTRWAERRLIFMDWVGNRQHGVVLPYNYWSTHQWHEAWMELGAKPDVWNTQVGLYPKPFKWLFENGLHFMARIPV
ncbi:MAG: methyltransferase domain-containing protein [Gemmatimonadaceae bacterium]